MNIQDAIIKKEGTLVDVRTPAEFMGGNVAGSINIPLQDVPDKLSEFKAMKQPLILFCAAGMRSAQAVQFLENEGIACYNAGGWMDVNNVLSKFSDDV